MTIENKKVLNTKEAAQYLGLCPSTLAKRRISNSQPKFSKLGKSVRYRLEDLDSWLEISLCKSTCEFTFQ